LDEAIEYLVDQILRLQPLNDYIVSMETRIGTRDEVEDLQFSQSSINPKNSMLSSQSFGTRLMASSHRKEKPNFGKQKEKCAC